MGIFRCSLRERGVLFDVSRLRLYNVSTIVITLEDKMLSVGIRELKARASDLVRLVRENGEDIRVTYHGRPVARLTTIVPALNAPQNAQAVWMDIDQLAAEIGAYWPEHVSAADAIADGRREL